MVTNKQNRRRANRGTPPICKSKKPDDTISLLPFLYLDAVWIDDGFGYYDIAALVDVNHPFHPCEEPYTAHWSTDPTTFGEWISYGKNFEPHTMNVGSTGTPITCQLYLNITWPDGDTDAADTPVIAPWVPLAHYDHRAAPLDPTFQTLAQNPPESHDPLA